MSQIVGDIELTWSFVHLSSRVQRVCRQRGTNEHALLSSRLDQRFVRHAEDIVYIAIAMHLVA